MTKETLVMLPGMMCDARLFAPQIAALEADYDIFVPKLCSPASITGLAVKVLAEVQAPCFNLLGLSMGGIVAMAMAGLAPDRIQRLALLDTNHHADASERHSIRNRQIEDVQAGHLRAVIAGEMKPNYLANRNRSNDNLLNALMEMAIDLGPECFVAQSIALRDRSNQSEALRRFPGPALVLCGAEDSLCPVSRHGEMLTLCQRGQMVVIPDAGHITTLEQPSKTNTEVMRWIKDRG